MAGAPVSLAGLDAASGRAGFEVRGFATPEDGDGGVGVCVCADAGRHKAATLNAIRRRRAPEIMIFPLANPLQR